MSSAHSTRDKESKKSDKKDKKDKKGKAKKFVKEMTSKIDQLENDSIKSQDQLSTLESLVSTLTDQVNTCYKKIDQLEQKLLAATISAPSRETVEQVTKTQAPAEENLEGELDTLHLETLVDRVEDLRASLKDILEKKETHYFDDIMEEYRAVVGGYIENVTKLLEQLDETVTIEDVSPTYKVATCQSHKVSLGGDDSDISDWEELLHLLTYVNKEQTKLVQVYEKKIDV